MKTTTFDHWLAGLFGQNESEIGLLLMNQTATRFLIAWSLLETRVFEGSLNADKIQIYAARLAGIENFDVSAVREHAQYFHARYQDKGLYKNLIHDDRSPDKKPSRNILREEIEEILKLTFDRLNAVQILVFSTFVVYRFRNNIFHGNKGVSSWLKFAEQIDRCTLVMRLLISHAETIQCRLKVT